MIIFILVVMLIAWISFTFGLCLINTNFKMSKTIKKSLWNGRIDQLGRKPFSIFMKVYEEKNYFKSFIMVLVCNMPGHVIMFLFGYIKIGLIMILVQPFMQGAIIGMGDDRTKLWGLITAIFEVSGFVVSCSLGFWKATELLWVSALFLIFNALIEAGGTLLDVQGVPGAQAIRNKDYIV